MIDSYTSYFIDNLIDDSDNRIFLTIEEFEHLLDECCMIIVDNSPKIPIEKVKRDTKYLLKTCWACNNLDHNITISHEDVKTIEKVEHCYIINNIYRISLLKVIYI